MRLTRFRGKYCIYWRENGKPKRISLRTDDRTVAEQRFRDTLKSLESRGDSIKDIFDAFCEEKPRITEAQFIAAQKWQERNGWPMFSDAQDTIDEYHAQNAEDHSRHKNAVIENERIAGVVGQATKALTTGRE